MSDIHGRNHGEPLRVMVTGSRFLAPTRALGAALDRAAGDARAVVLVHGRCDPRQAWGDREPVPWNRAMLLPHGERALLLGGDWQAHLHAQARGWTEEPHPARWGLHGHRAGFVRNSLMVEHGARVLVAAPQHGESNKGTSMCADLAKAAGIPVVWVRSQPQSS